MTENLTIIGDITKKVDRARAVGVMKQGGMVQMVCGYDNRGVASIFFDITNPNAVDLVVKRKSFDNKSRQALFGIMTPASVYGSVADLPYTINLEGINRAPCFLLTPIRDAANFPEAAVKRKGNLPYALCFISDAIDGFSELVNTARKWGMEVGGTSQNVTGTGNIRRGEEARVFFYQTPGPKMWLKTGVPLTGDSFTVLELDPARPEAKLWRPGSSDYALACSLLGLAPITKG